MKKKQSRVIAIPFVMLAIFAVIVIVSHDKTLRVENEVLKPCLSASESYIRSEKFGVCNPWASMLPHWTIRYSVSSASKNYENPSITVDFRGKVVDWQSKEVAIMLVDQGYRAK